MSIEWFRDLTICILGLVAAGVLIFIATLLFLLYRRIKAILVPVEATSKTVERIVSRVENEVVKPVIQVVSFIQVIRQGIDTFSKFFSKKEGGKK